MGGCPRAPPPPPGPGQRGGAGGGGSLARSDEIVETQSEPGGRAAGKALDRTSGDLLGGCRGGGGGGRWTPGFPPSTPHPPQVCAGGGATERCLSFPLWGLEYSWCKALVPGRGVGGKAGAAGGGSLCHHRPPWTPPAEVGFQPMTPSPNYPGQDAGSTLAWLLPG